MAFVLHNFLAPFLDRESQKGGTHARNTGRSWWAVRSSIIDDWIHEWDVDPSSPNRHMDWPRLQKRGRQAVRLYCPNGKLAQLGDDHDASGKLFQFKIGRRNTMVNDHAGVSESSVVEAHVIGMVTGLSGECVMYAWEVLPEPPIPANAPRPPSEKEFIAKSAEPGLFEEAVAKWHLDFDAFEKTREFQRYAVALHKWNLNARGRLVGPIHDNVNLMSHYKLAPLNADVLGIDDGEGR